MESLSVDEFYRTHEAKRVAVLGMLGDRESDTELLIIEGRVYRISVERMSNDDRIDEFFSDLKPKEIK